MLWSTDAALVGRRYPVNDELDDALKGELVVHSGRLGSEGPAKAEHEGLALRAPFFVESYIPVRDAPGGQVVGVMEFYKVPVQLNEAIRSGLIQLWLACAASALVLFLSLYWIVARADRALREQQARLAETQTLATAVELAGAVAHNLRNPLASIRVSAEMLQDGTSEPAETTEHCQDITSAVDRADRWITELVRVSQAPQLQDEAVALGPLVRACLEEMGAEMMRRNIRWQAPEHDPAPVRAHPAMLRQIVLSLIANAIDAMPEGGELTASLHEHWRTLRPAHHRHRPRHFRRGAPAPVPPLLQHQERRAGHRPGAGQAHGHAVAGRGHAERQSAARHLRRHRAAPRHHLLRTPHGHAADH
jgi:two-component system sensor histidine kinase HydH